MFLIVEWMHYCVVMNAVNYTVYCVGLYLSCDIVPLAVICVDVLGFSWRQHVLIVAATVAYCIGCMKQAQQSKLHLRFLRHSDLTDRRQYFRALRVLYRCRRSPRHVVVMTVV